jgi:hypothetical protein
MITSTERVAQEERLKLGAQPRVGLLAFLRPFLAVLWKDWPKPMRVSNFDPSDGRFTLSGECPHCRDKVGFNPVTTSWHDQGPAYDRWIAGLRCPSCGEPILGIVGFGEETNGARTLEYLEHYPLGKPPQWESGSGIPEHILDDFNEALRCRSVDAYNATADMCGGALQASCLEKGVDPKLKLRDQIDCLASQGKITALLQKTAHTIRLGRDRGAHPPDEPKEEIPLDGQDGDALIEFTGQFLLRLYVDEAKLSKFDFSKQGRKKP